VLAWVASVEDAHLPAAAATLGELQAGMESARDQDSAKAEEV
jgi:hypothetical protein